MRPSADSGREGKGSALTGGEQANDPNLEEGATVRTIWETLLGPLGSPLRHGVLGRGVTRLLSIPAWLRWPLAVGLFAALIFLPFLGSTGLWDPWETHYAEVARSMMERGDYVHPYWEHAYFFSKPVLNFWLMTLGMHLTGLHGPAGAMPVYTEWMVRLPIALLAIFGVVMAYLAGAHVFSKRVGAIAGVALATMPVYALVARQAMTDMPFVSLMSGAVFALMVALFGAKTPAESPSPGEPDETGERAPLSATWLYTFYVLCGFAALAKGLLGVALPGAVALVYLVVTGRWGLLRRLRIPTGILVTLAVAAPWYLVMSFFSGRDDEFKSFAYRFFVHDHFQRLAMGVHTTTPGGTFTYFIEQLGFGSFPWVTAVPAAFMLAGRELAAGFKGRRVSGLLFLVLWILVAFTTFSLSATKFHHYCIPVIPPLALLIGVFLDRLWEEGIERHWLGLLFGLVLTSIIAQNLSLQPKHFVDLYVYNYTRPYPSREVNPRAFFAVLFGLFGLWLFASLIWKRRRAFFGGLAAFGIIFAIYLSWVHWVQLSPHWTQRNLFWTYYHSRTADEPIAAYNMNWRGETFYSQNSVVQIKDATRLRSFAAEPGTEYVLVEQGRYKGLQSILGRYKLRILDRSSNKFYLVQVADPPPSS